VPIHFATYSGNLAVAEMLLTAGCNLGIDTPHHATSHADRLGLGCQVMHIAAKQGHEEMMRLLIQYGADINHIDSSGM
jgi:ankyrin repeat protein